MTTINQDDFQFGQWSIEDITKRYMQRMMQPVQEAVWDMASGGLGILGKDGSILTLDVISKEDGIFGVSQNDFAMFAMPIPAFAQQISVDSVVIEDFVYVNGKPFGWVTKIIKSDSSNIAFEILKPNGQQSRWSPPKIQSMMMPSGVNVQVLRTMISMFGSDKKISNMKDLIMPMIMMGGGNMDSISKMIPMMMMMGDSKMDPMMMFMMMNQMGNNNTQNALPNPIRNNPFKRS